MTSIILTMAFLLVWPTLAGAMTGYTSASGAFVTDNQHNLISFASFAQCHTLYMTGGGSNFRVIFWSRTSRTACPMVRLPELALAARDAQLANVQQSP